LSRAALVAFLIAAACPAAAKDIGLGFPLDCSLPESCTVSAYVDADGGPGAADFTCAPASFDGHLGTDIAAPAGAAVLAAAPGRVLMVQDPVSGATPPVTTLPDPEEAECHRSVTIDHGGGWQSRYCGFAPGTITVSSGRRVAMGQVLGRIAPAAEDAPPHLHFSLRQNGRVRDPYNAGGIPACQGGSPETLWLDPAIAGPGR